MWAQLHEKALFPIHCFFSCSLWTKTSSWWTPPTRCTSYKGCWRDGWRAPFQVPFQGPAASMGKESQKQLRVSRGSGHDDALFHSSSPTSLCAFTHNTSGSCVTFCSQNLFWNLSLTDRTPWDPCLWSLNPKYCITSDLPKYRFHWSYLTAHKTLTASCP